jgi:hypothetical protein
MLQLLLFGGKWREDIPVEVLDISYGLRFYGDVNVKFCLPLIFMSRFSQTQAPTFRNVR